MTRRVLSTFGLVGSIVLLLWLFGTQAALWMIVVATFLAQWELYELLIKIGSRPLRRIGLFFGVVILTGTYYLTPILEVPVRRIGTDLLILAVVGASIAVIALEKEYSHKFRSLVSTLFGIFYVPFLMHFLVLTLVLFRNPDDTINHTAGLLMALWLVFTAKTSDIGALLFGRWFGRHQMAPLLSPKKTWEGAAGGALTSMAVGGVFAWFGRDYFPEHFTVFYAVVLALPIALIAIVSDLVESLFKRQAGVKDSGVIIPGIGGAFDLTDSLLLTAPFGYFILSYVIV